jgi:hypothetical protein
MDNEPKPNEPHFDWNAMLQKNFWVYCVCLISILICMVYYYNIEKYQQANTHAWEKFVMDCGCECIERDFEPMFEPNITKQFNIPIYHEIMEEKQNASTT